MATTKITSIGETDLYRTKNNRATLNVNGSFSGGTLVVGYRNDSGTFTEYSVNADLTADGEWVLDCGPGVLLMVNFFGGTGSPIINIEHHGWYDG